MSENSIRLSEMSVEDLRQLVARIVDEKLEELVGDPDRGRQLTDEVKERLKKTSKIRRGAPAHEVAKRLGITW